MDSFRYWGTVEVFKIFNRDAFIFYDPDDPASALEKIKSLERDSQLYAKMRSEPILAEGALEQYFSWHDNVGGGQLRKRIRAVVEGGTS